VSPPSPAPPVVRVPRPAPALKAVMPPPPSIRLAPRSGQPRKRPDGNGAATPPEAP
jgi:hypothetical protein